VIAGIPVAFALGVVRGGFAKTRELEELASWLGTVDRDKATLEAALADTLGDPSLRLSFWVAAAEIFVDHHGDVVPHEASNPERGTVEVSLEGKLVGAITYNAALIADPEQVRAAGGVVAIAVDRDRLTAELRASQRALQQSRERLVVAADEERKRIAQDLHDGLRYSWSC
jgi:signal transduction histidine kinase